MYVIVFVLLLLLLFISSLSSFLSASVCVCVCVLGFFNLMWCCGEKEKRCWDYHFYLYSFEKTIMAIHWISHICDKCLYIFIASFVRTTTVYYTHREVYMVHIPKNTHRHTRILMYAWGSKTYSHLHYCSFVNFCFIWKLRFSYPVPCSRCCWKNGSEWTHTMLVWSCKNYPQNEIPDIYVCVCVCIWTKILFV